MNEWGVEPLHVQTFFIVFFCRKQRKSMREKMYVYISDSDSSVEVFEKGCQEFKEDMFSGMYNFCCLFFTFSNFQVD